MSIFRFLVLTSVLSTTSAAQAALFAPVTDVRGVAAGEFHSCLVLHAGAVECFGLNEHGQLGDGGTGHRVTAAPVTGLNDATQVVVGAAHSCALRDGGTVACWGRNDTGQLGDGSEAASTVPVVVTGLPEVAALSAGAHHTCAVTTAGAAWCWGANASGQLGDGSTIERSTPVAVSAPLPDLAQVDAGGEHTCAVTTAGAAWCWGENAQGQLGTGDDAPSALPVPVPGLSTGVDSVAAGIAHACAVRDDGSVACWGRNIDAQAGSPASPPQRVPVAVEGLQHVTRITAGRTHSCALRSDAGVTCWGSGAIIYPPVTLSGITAIDATHDHTCAVQADGAARCVGQNSHYGELGTGYARARLDAVRVAEQVKEVGSGTTFSCALDLAGRVRCWGQDDGGEVFGAGVFSRPEPTLIPGLGEVGALSVGSHHVCALQGSTATCWGGLGGGEVGLPNAWESIPTPSQPVAGVGPIASLHAGVIHTCAVTEEGAAVCWGVGPRGDGSLDDSGVPVQVLGLSTGVHQVVGGAGHRCVLLDGGSVQCWGHLNTQPLDAPNPTIGDGAGVSRLTPVPVPGLANVVALGAGWVHTCAVLDAGEVWCWGFNHDGQLGDGTTTARFTPVQVPGIDDAVAVFAGSHHTCALLGDASAACWGRGRSGQLGQGRRESSLVPVPLTIWDEPLADFGIGDSFTCAVSVAGALRCWGGNDNGKLGEAGLQTFRPTVQRSLSGFHVFEAGFESL